MNTMLLSIAGLALGGSIGTIFGVMQNNAVKRYQRQEDRGRFTSGWSVVPGSMRRTASLLLLLAAVQILCPVFFQEERVPWLISAGVVVGYGWMLLQQLRRRSW